MLYIDKDINEYSPKTDSILEAFASGVPYVERNQSITKPYRSDVITTSYK